MLCCQRQVVTQPVIITSFCFSLEHPQRQTILAASNDASHRLVTFTPIVLFNQSTSSRSVPAVIINLLASHNLRFGCQAHASFKLLLDHQRNYSLRNLFIRSSHIIYTNLRMPATQANSFHSVINTILSLSGLTASCAAACCETPS